MATQVLNNGTGVYAPGTTRRTGLNMYDTAASNFHPLPDGPYEASNVQGQATAQTHFNSIREIKLKDRYGLSLPTTSYRDHYPPKGPLPQDDLPHDLAVPGRGAPFTAKSEYDDQYFARPRMPRPVNYLHYTHVSPPWLLQETTNQATYKPFGIRPHTVSTGQRETRPAYSLPRQIPSTWETTYKTQYTPKDAPERMPVGQAEPRAYPPWMAGLTTYQDHYIPKELGLRPVTMEAHIEPYPFSGTTEFKDQYTHKEGYPVMPPLTGTITRAGLQLPLPRRSLGVEFYHRGQTNQYYVLIPRTTAVPCRAKQVFTTVHDNQQQACVLILYGDDPVASNNVLLGQFDIVNIPPAPKDMPRIEITYTLDKDSYLTVEARDLDTERHKLWQQRGQIVVLKA